MGVGIILKLLLIYIDWAPEYKKYIYFYFTQFVKSSQANPA